MSDPEGVRGLSPLEQMDKLVRALDASAADESPRNIEFLSGQVGRIANLTGSPDILLIAERADKDEMIAILREVMFYNIEQQMLLEDPGDM